MRPITPVTPAGQFREVFLHARQKRAPVNAIKCILKVNLQEDLIWHRPLPFRPLPDRVDCTFRSERARHTYL